MLKGHVRYALLRGDRQMAVAAARVGHLAAQEAIRAGAPLPGHLTAVHLTALLASGDPDIRTFAIRHAGRDAPE